MMTTTELAAALDTTPRTLRKFLRSADSGIESVGKGARYALPSTKREVNALTKRFTAWGAAQAEVKAAKAPKVEEVEVEAQIDADAPDMTDDEPTDDELMMIDDELDSLDD